MAWNIKEIIGRGAQVICIATSLDREITRIAYGVRDILKSPEILAPILSIIPMQFLAYFFARNLKKDIDKPRNLAKSVTVE